MSYPPLTLDARMRIELNNAIMADDGLSREEQRLLIEDLSELRTGHVFQHADLTDVDISADNHTLFGRDDINVLIALEYYGLDR